MKEFAVGAATIAVGCAVVTVILMLLEPLGAWGEMHSGMIGHFPRNQRGLPPVVVALTFLIAIIICICSQGIGRGVLNEMRLRKKSDPPDQRKLRLL